MRNKLLLFLAVIFAVVFGGQSVYAAQRPDGLTVSPAFQMVTIAKGAEAQPVSFKLTNNLSVPQNLTLSVADFSSLNESGGLFFVGSNPSQLQKKYGLAKWFSLPQSQLTLQPKQTLTVNGQVLNLPDLNPGGHYGALMISLSDQKPSAGQVGIHPIASSLLFVTKPDGATYDLGLSNVFVKHSLFKLPDSVTLRFHNDGNTHLIPRGVVSLTTPKDKLISKGIINENSSIILPQNYRRYTVSLRPVESPGWGGKYKLKVDFRFDGMRQYRSYQTSFSYVSAKVVVVILILLSAVAYLLFVPSSVTKKALRIARLSSRRHKAK